MYRQASIFTEFLARNTALAGGIVLLAVVIMTCVSIIGRSLTGIGLAPVPGDFELVEIGVGFAIFSFIPWCHLRRGNATVDLFMNAFGPRINKVIDVVADALALGIAAILTRQLWLGLLDKKGYGETTFILQFPVWISYTISFVGCAVFLIVAIFCLVRSVRALAGAPA